MIDWNELSADNTIIEEIPYEQGATFALIQAVFTAEAWAAIRFHGLATADVVTRWLRIAGEWTADDPRGGFHGGMGMPPKGGEAWSLHFNCAPANLGPFAHLVTGPVPAVVVVRKAPRPDAEPRPLSDHEWDALEALLGTTFTRAPGR